MSDRLHCEGDWPGPLTLRQGWAKATARPWNDETGVAVRLHRGSSEFLGRVGRYLGGLSHGMVLSPALHPGAARIWERAGFSPLTRLDVMERSLDHPIDTPVAPVEPADHPDWDQIVALDRAAFEGWWRMGRHGLEEAMAATPRSVLLTIPGGDGPGGYALVGVQMGVSFLQRVAVDPSRSGRGLGSSLVRRSMGWARERGARVMVLNVRPRNEQARRLYAREGFVATGSSLVVLRFDG